jgi:molecular chaperone GrpE
VSTEQKASEEEMIKEESREENGTAEENVEKEAASAETEGKPEESPAEAEETDAEEKEAPEHTEEKPLSRAERKAAEAAKKEIEALKDRHLRTLAEYENFRKRTEREKADIYAFAVRDAMAKILPVLDNLERGVSAIPEESANDPFAEGMKQICKQFEKALDDIGVKPMNAAGTPFDPNLHQAVMHVEDPELEKNVVAAELLKGYTYKDTVVRHAMVSVAN